METVILEVDTCIRCYWSTEEGENNSFPMNQVSLHEENAIWVVFKWFMKSKYIPNTENRTFKGKMLEKGIMCLGKMRRVVSLVGNYLQ